MITKLNVKAAINPLSLGQVGFNILRELYKRKIQVVLFPRQIDFSPFKVDPAFGQWIERCVNTRYDRLDRKVPTANIWHLQDSENRLSDKQVTLSFHETDSPTNAEVSIANHQDKTLFTSNWTVENFRQYGANNVGFVPLGLDEDFVPSERRLVPDEITHWILVGKHENLRKMTDAKVQAWIKRYGGNRAHQLTICVDNPFFQKQTVGFDMNDIYARMFGNPNWQQAKPFNVNVLPHLKTNEEMLRLYQSADVDLSGLSRGEGWNIPAFTATALGKWSIVSNCSAHKDWATAENSILVEPMGLIKAEDGIFFREGQPFSQGNFFNFAPDAFDQAMVKAEKKAKTVNTEGLKLAAMTYKQTVDKLLEAVEG